MPALVKIAAALALAGASSLVAAPAMAAPKPAPTVTSVSIDCGGDRISTTVSIADPQPGKKVALALAGADGSTWSQLGSREVGLGNKTSYDYDFNIAGQHRQRYQVTATVGSSSKTSEVITDATCAPPAEVPEAPWVALLPVSMLAAAGAVVAARRRSAEVGA